MSGFYSWHGKGGAITIFNDGVLLGDVTEIDFTGAGQSGSVTNGVLTENIPGGETGNFVYDETPTQIDSSNFTLANTPNPAGSLILWRNNANLVPDVDFTLTGNAIVLMVPLDPGETLLAKQYTF